MDAPFDLSVTDRLLSTTRAVRRRPLTAVRTPSMPQ